jgi:hypothetical protein
MTNCTLLWYIYVRGWHQLYFYLQKVPLSRKKGTYVHK